MLSLSYPAPLRQPARLQEIPDFIGDPGRIRTCDLQLRRQWDNKLSQCHSDKSALCGAIERKALIGAVRTPTGRRDLSAEAKQSGVNAGIIAASARANPHQQKSGHQREQVAAENWIDKHGKASRTPAGCASPAQ